MHHIKGEIKGGVWHLPDKIGAQFGGNLSQRICQCPLSAWNRYPIRYILHRQSEFSLVKCIREGLPTM